MIESYGGLVDKTILAGAIDVSADQHFIALIGEGDVADSLDTITLTGGGYPDVGFVIVLTRKTGKAYIITMDGSGGYFKLQYHLFNLDNEYDDIVLIHHGSGIWIEQTRASNS